MEHPYEPVLDWLKGCKNHMIRVEKTETDDLDVTQMRVEDVTLIRHQGEDKLDDYLAETEIILYGEGKVLNTKEQPPLPRKQFEIPLSGEWQGNLWETSLNLKTDRASYVITKQESSRLH